MMDAPEIKQAPFSEADVAKIQHYQVDARYHPYTCDHDHKSVAMRMVTDGLKCPQCGLVQDWILQVTLDLMKGVQ